MHLIGEKHFARLEAVSSVESGHAAKSFGAALKAAAGGCAVA